MEPATDKALEMVQEQGAKIEPAMQMESATGNVVITEAMPQ